MEGSIAPEGISQGAFALDKPIKKVEASPKSVLESGYVGRAKKLGIGASAAVAIWELYNLAFPSPVYAAGFENQSGNALSMGQKTELVVGKESHGPGYYEAPFEAGQTAGSAADKAYGESVSGEGVVDNTWAYQPDMNYVVVSESEDGKQVWDVFIGTRPFQDSGAADNPDMFPEGGSVKMSNYPQEGLTKKTQEAFKAGESVRLYWWGKLPSGEAGVLDSTTSPIPQGLSINYLGVNNFGQ